MSARSLMPVFNIIATSRASTAAGSSGSNRLRAKYSNRAHTPNAPINIAHCCHPTRKLQLPDELLLPEASELEPPLNGSRLGGDETAFQKSPANSEKLSEELEPLAAVFAERLFAVLLIGEGEFAG